MTASPPRIPRRRHRASSSEDELGGQFRMSRWLRSAYPHSRSRSAHLARVPIVALSSSNPARSSCRVRRSRVYRATPHPRRPSPRPRSGRPGRGRTPAARRPDGRGPVGLSLLARACHRPADGPPPSPTTVPAIRRPVGSRVTGPAGPPKSNRPPVVQSLADASEDGLPVVDGHFPTPRA
jgi:hypothetical protein